MKNLMMIIAVICFLKTSSAQTSSVDSTNFLYNRVYKNIAAYNIRYAAYSFNGAIDNSPFYSTDNFFYEGFLPDFNSKLLMEINKLDIKYPVKGYDVYEIVLNGMRFKNDKEISYKSGISPGKYYLAAVKINKEEIKFISGQFFVSAIGPDFHLNLKDPTSLLEYLKFKLYSQKLQSIKFVKTKDHKFYYTAFSEQFKKQYEIILDKNKIEYPTVKSIK